MYSACRLYIRDPYILHAWCVVHTWCDHRPHTHCMLHHRTTVHNRVYTGVYTSRNQEIKFGDASQVIRDNRSKIIFDEFEYDQTSMRRIILPIVCNRC